MTFAAIDNTTLLNWHAQAVAAQTLLNSHRVVSPSQPQVVPPVEKSADEDALQGRPSHQVIGLVAWLHSLQTEMQNRGLAALAAASPNAQ